MTEPFVPGAAPEEPRTEPEPEAAVRVHEQARFPALTLTLATVLTALFGVEQWCDQGKAAPGLFGVSVSTLFSLGGMNRRAVLQDGEWYRLLTAALWHGDLLHLLFNGVALAVAGYVLESLLGRAWLMVLFVIGTLGGSLMGLAVNPANQVSVGVSGAVMGLLAAALVASYRYPVGRQRSEAQMSVVRFLVPSLLPLATTTGGGRVDYAAHIGGALAGALAGFVLLRIWPKNQPHPPHRRTATALAFVAAACFVVALLSARRGYAEYSQELLVDDAKIPELIEQAKREVDDWGKGYPRDPRVRLYRALKLLDERQPAAAESELRAALADRRLLDEYFTDHKLETVIRAALAQQLMRAGKKDEALSVAAPLCHADHGAAPEQLAALGVCP